MQSGELFPYAHHISVEAQFQRGPMPIQPASRGWISVTLVDSDLQHLIRRAARSVHG